MEVTREDIIERLKQLGFEPDAEDYDAIDFELEKIINYTLNYCNIPTVEELPALLKPRLIDRVCCEYLFNKKNAGILEGFDYDTVVKEIKEGDTTLRFSVGSGEDTPENRFDSLVKKLEKGYDKWITPHRRLRW